MDKGGQGILQILLSFHALGAKEAFERAKAKLSIKTKMVKRLGTQ